MKEIFKKLWNSELKLINKIIFIFIVGFIIICAGFGVNEMLQFIISIERESLTLFFTILIGFTASIIAYLQWKTSRMALEQSRPNIEISIEPCINNSIPYIKISNKGNAESEILECYYKDKLLVENNDTKGIIINQQDEYFTELLNANANNYISVVIIYKNILSGRIYLYSKNINCGSKEIKNIVESRITRTNIVKNPPLIREDYYIILHYISKNPYSFKSLKKLLNL